MPRPLSPNRTRRFPSLRVRLLRRREALSNMLEERATRVKTADHGTLAVNEETSTHALQEADLALDLAEISRETAEFQCVETALAMMNDGRYGVCLNCGAEIGLARLTARPMALHCMVCETALEKRALSTA